MWTFTPFAIPLFFGTIVLLTIAAVSWRRRSTQGARYVFWAALTLAFYVFGYAIELGSPTLDGVRFWLKVQYVGVNFAPVMLFALILSYTGGQRWLAPEYLVLLLIIPAATLGLAWTNELHGLIWHDMSLERIGATTLTDFTPGAWYWVRVGYYWILMLAGATLLVRALVGASGLYRRQVITMLAGMLIPLPFFLMYLMRVLAFNLDINAYTYTITGICFAWAVFSYQLLDVMPIAREAIVASMGDAVLVLDAQNRVVDLNPVARRLVGAKADSAVGRPAAEVLSAWPDVVSRYRDVSESHDEIALTVNGTLHTFDIRISPVHSPARQPAGRVIVLRDVTARTTAQSALQASNKRLTTLRHVDRDLSKKLNVKYVASIALDAAMRISSADAAFLGLLEPHGIRVLDALGENTLDKVNQMIPNSGIAQRVIRRGEAERVLDVSTDPDYLPLIPGTRAQVSIPLVSLGKPLGILTVESAYRERFTLEVFESLKLLAARVAVAIDNAQVYEERERLVAELRTFAHTVAHDLKGPLSLILGYATILDSQEAISPEEHHDQVQRIIRGAEKATEIIDALLLLARAHDTNEVVLEPVDMTDVVSKVSERFAPLIEQYGATLVTPQDWPVVIGYSPWLEEVWSNYVSNALKYGGRPPNVELGFDPQGNDFVRFWVRDNGLGLSPDAQAKLFSPFTRLESASKIEGHGLGLSIVQRIVERFGGEVGVESQVGEGSRFYFTLPRSDGTDGV